MICKKYEILVYGTGTKQHYLNGSLHRENGPAVERVNGDKEWWMNGVQLTEEEFNQRNSMKVIRPVFIFRKDDTYYVHEVSHWDYTTYPSAWMDPALGDECVDMTSCVHKFDNEQEALKKVASLYAAQLDV